jgi:hypothetical protein
MWIEAYRSGQAVYQPDATLRAVISLESEIRTEFRKWWFVVVAAPSIGCGGSNWCCACAGAGSTNACLTGMHGLPAEQRCVLALICMGWAGEFILQPQHASSAL